MLSCFCNNEDGVYGKMTPVPLLVVSQMISQGLDSFPTGILPYSQNLPSEEVQPGTSAVSGHALTGSLSCPTEETTGKGPNKMVLVAAWFFLSFQMGNPRATKVSTPQIPQTLKRKCAQEWPQHKLANGDAWPSEGSINYNTIL